MFLAPESLLLHTPRAPLLCESHPADERHQGAQDDCRTGKHDRVEKVAIPIREQASADWIATDRGTGDEDKGDPLSESAQGTVSARRSRVKRKEYKRTLSLRGCYPRRSRSPERQERQSRR